MSTHPPSGERVTQRGVPTLGPNKGVHNAFELGYMLGPYFGSPTDPKQIFGARPAKLDHHGAPMWKILNWVHLRAQRGTTCDEEEPKTKFFMIARLCYLRVSLCFLFL